MELGSQEGTLACGGVAIRLRERRKRWLEMHGAFQVQFQG